MSFSLRRSGFVFICIAAIACLISLLPLSASAETDSVVNVIIDKDGKWTLEPAVAPLATEMASKGVASGPRVALFFGMCDYENPSTPDLEGPQNDIIGMAKIFESEYDTYTYLDNTKAEMLAAINAKATTMDSGGILMVSYSGHGSDIGCLVSVDGLPIYVSELEAALDQYTGTKVVFIDACFSGQFIGKDAGAASAMTPEEFNAIWIDGLTGADTAKTDDVTAKNLAKTDYQVLTASSGSQYSWEDGFMIPESQFAADNYYVNSEGYYPLGIFSKSFHTGVGLYDAEIFANQYADYNMNAEVTMYEMYTFTRQRINSMLAGSDYTQSVQIYPSYSSFVLYAQDFVYSDNGDGTATITDYMGNAVNMVVPETIAGLTVVAIADNALQQNPIVQTVMLPDTIATIGEYAFHGCSNLAEIYLPEGLTSIGNFAFAECNLSAINLPSTLETMGAAAFNSNINLPSVVVPEGVTDIGAYAFFNCTGLTSAELPGTLINMGEMTFGECKNLASITVSGTGGAYEAVDNVLYKNSQTELVRYLGTKPETEFTIPNSVTDIDARAFEYAENLKSIKNSENIQTIYGTAFYFCSNLREIDLPDSLSLMGEAPFIGCVRLNHIETGFNFRFERGALMDEARTTIYFYQPYRFSFFYEVPDMIERIGFGAFMFNRYLTKVEIPDGVTTVGNDAFSNSVLLSEIELPATVTGVGAYAFADSPKLKKVTILPSTTEIGYDAQDTASDNILSGSASAVIYGVAGSYTQDYALQCGLKFASVVEPLPLNGVSVDYPGADVRVQNDTIGIGIEIADVPAGETAEYQLTYSTNGGKSFRPIEKIWTAYTAPETINYTLPTASRDKDYIFRLQARTVGSTILRYSDSFEITICPVMSLASVTLDSVGDENASQIVPADGIMLAATATNRAGYSETPTYRFAYREEGSTKWKYISKAFSEENSIKFIPKTEGTYYFMVEAQSLGRRTKSGDASDYDYSAYALFNSAQPVKGIYDLTADKKDYTNDQPAMTLTMNVAQNDALDDVEYRLLYSTNGKSYRVIDDYTPLTVVAGVAKIERDVMPPVKKDTIFYMKVEVRTVGRTEKEPDAFAMTQVEYMTAYPVEDGEVVMGSVGNGDSEQSIGAGITLTASGGGFTEYRFAYQKLGDSKWRYISKTWSQSNNILFMPSNEGRYRFMVESRSMSRRTIDATDVTDYYGLYFNSMGAVSVSIDATETEFINSFEHDVEVPIVINLEGNGTDTYDYRLLYSKNGRKYIEYSGAIGNGPGATVDWSGTSMLPSVTRDTHYWIKIEAMTTGHTAADVFDTTEVDVYVGEPLTSIDSFFSDAYSGTRVLLFPEDGLALEADANADAVYKFYYRLEGTTKWAQVRDVADNTAFFRPKKEGAYEFKVEASAPGRSLKKPDVSEELGETIDIWFDMIPVETADMSVTDDDNDYIIGLDDEMNLQLDVTGDENDMEYQIVYSKNGGKSYKPLSAWQILTLAGDGSFDVTCPAPAARKDTLYLIKAQVRSLGRSTVDAESDAVEIWMLNVEREVTTELTIAEDVYEYTDTITANVAISEPVMDMVEYQLLYSTDNKKWKPLSAHDWEIYEDGGTGSIDVDLNLAELSGDTEVLIKLNARLEDSTKIEDFAVDSFMVYSIAPVESVDMGVFATGEESVAIEAGADSGGIGHTVEYRYSYALLGQKKLVWVPFTSWIESDEVTFTPSLSGDYQFMVEARNQGRLTVDATAEATNGDVGYYLKSIEDMMAEALPEPSVAPTPSASAEPSASPSAAPSASIAPSASAEPSATPSEAPISSLEFSVNLALGEDTDLSGYTESEVALEDILSVLTSEDAPTVLVQLGEDAYAVITGYETDEAGALTSLTLTDQMGEGILGGTDGILKAWYYLPVEPEATPSESTEPSEAPSASAAPAPSATPEV